MKATETAVLILAAGASRRLGRPKQQLIFHNQTLLKRMIDTATALEAGPVLVVLGSHKELNEQENFITITNPHWEEGMAASIRCGIEKLKKDFPAVDAVLITVCDQPYVTADLLNEIISMHRHTALPVVACTYADTMGTPVLFHKSIFTELMELSGDKGARQLLNKDHQRVGLVNFPLGNIDIDTEEDYERLLKQ